MPDTVDPSWAAVKEKPKIAATKTLSHQSLTLAQDWRRMAPAQPIMALLLAYHADGAPFRGVLSGSVHGEREEWKGGASVTPRAPAKSRILP
jgi:hypothetical protein